MPSPDSCADQLGQQISQLLQPPFAWEQALQVHQLMLQLVQEHGRVARKAADNERLLLQAKSQGHTELGQLKHAHTQSYDQHRQASETLQEVLRTAQPSFVGPLSVKLKSLMAELGQAVAHDFQLKTEQPAVAEQLQAMLDRPCNQTQLEQLSEILAMPLTFAVFQGNKVTLDHQGIRYSKRR